MKLVLLGSSGFLGMKIKSQIIDDDVMLTCPAREDFIFNNDRLDFSPKLLNALSNADICINCIAETNFNSCESDFKSRIANELIPLELCKYLHKDQYMIHISSDIFYEQRDNFSSEESKLNINNQYAIQKFNGEEILKKIDPLILRTSFMGINHRGTGLLNHIYRAIDNEISMNGWTNVYSSSISIDMLVNLIFSVTKHKIRGTYNFGTLAPYSKFDYIQSILERFGKKSLVRKTNLSKLAYQRNKNCGMDSSKISKKLKIKLPSFSDVVEDSLKAMEKIKDS